MCGLPSLARFKPSGFLLVFISSSSEKRVRPVHWIRFPLTDPAFFAFDVLNCLLGETRPGRQPYILQQPTLLPTQRPGCTPLPPESYSNRRTWSVLIRVCLPQNNISINPNIPDILGSLQAEGCRMGLGEHIRSYSKMSSDHVHRSAQPQDKTITIKHDIPDQASLDFAISSAPGRQTSQCRPCVILG